MTKLTALSLFIAAIAGTNGFSTSPLRNTPLTQLSNTNDDDIPSSTSQIQRRNFLSTVTAAATSAALLPFLASSPANASGGATAGKYTTIPIAKRRYYGRVQEAVHEFLLMTPAVIAGDLNDPTVQDFFDVTKTVVVEGKKKDINGVCTKKDGDCKSANIYDSRYNDMKTTMYLLGNAFRINQTKAPENLPSVQASKKFFKQMNIFERKVLGKKMKKSEGTAAEIYATALDLLDEYLDLVELPPTDSGNYDSEFSTKVGLSSRIT
eukprot:CAMPEP_0172304848 /NCGR_PEP_ID=MMETSP1058-20130122/6218_1 /TAXON_ID=83371 /ORGANISM="Detonula confervacea, Strain CCMP 353" /LENGTH=264 /DNA_ID=CAMNT_0013016241 /DNA_START=34 /DNA_END=828 /DNA_ORIENTATION=+